MTAGSEWAFIAWPRYNSSIKNTTHKRCRHSTKIKGKYLRLYPDPWDVRRSYAWARLPWKLQVWSLARYHRDFEAVIEYSWQIRRHLLTAAAGQLYFVKSLCAAGARSFRSRLRSNKVKAHPWAHFREEQRQKLQWKREEEIQLLCLICYTTTDYLEM